MHRPSSCANYHLQVQRKALLYLLCRDQAAHDSTCERLKYFSILTVAQVRIRHLDGSSGYRELRGFPYRFSAGTYASLARRGVLEMIHPEASRTLSTEFTFSSSWRYLSRMQKAGLRPGKQRKCTSSLQNGDSSESEGSLEPKRSARKRKPDDAPDYHGSIYEKLNDTRKAGKLARQKEEAESETGELTACPKCKGINVIPAHLRPDQYYRCAHCPGRAEKKYRTTKKHWRTFAASIDAACRCEQCCKLLNLRG